MNDDFSGYPKSITETKADREPNAKTCTPRDALIGVLRDLDEGKINTDVLVVSWIEKEVDPKHSDGFSFSASSQDFNRTIGLLQRVMIWMLRNDQGD